METGIQPWAQLGWWGVVKRTEGPRTDDSNTLADKTSVKAPGRCCLPTPHHGHCQPHMHTFSFYPAEVRLKRTSLEGRSEQQQDSLNTDYRKGAGLLQMFPSGISKTRQVWESRISNVQIKLPFYLQRARQLFPCPLGVLSASTNPPNISGFSSRSSFSGKPSIPHPSLIRRGP